VKDDVEAVGALGHFLGEVLEADGTDSGGDDVGEVELAGCGLGLRLARAGGPGQDQAEHEDGGSDMTGRRPHAGLLRARGVDGGPHRANRADLSSRSASPDRDDVTATSFDNPRRPGLRSARVRVLGRAVMWAPDVVVTALMLVAMVDMLAGVFLRYVVTWISARFDLPTVRFFWVEEIGEYPLAGLTFIGPAIGIRRGTHFAVHLVVDRLPPRLRRAVFAGIPSTSTSSSRRPWASGCSCRRSASVC
jgi:Tripartite ATP-independent periplasmic transporters, DctQ component